ncbi:hypothetical protein ACFL2J_00740 [Candidatus Omnitrophota bacterium]
MRRLVNIALLLLCIFGVIFIYQNTVKYINESRILKDVILNLEADSRVAEVLVTDVNYDERLNKTKTTIKFLEYNSKSNPLQSKYFTFWGNIIQFQSLVIRFDDIYIRNKDMLRGRSAYLFWKVFMLDGPNTLEYEISKINEVPLGYRVSDSSDNSFEKKLWEKFWSYALDPESAKKMGVRNAQIEAPGSVFIPGTLYTIKIEHDGGMRIDAQPLPKILKGERIP